MFLHRVRSLGIRDHPTSARSPWQNGYTERLIGSIRRECLNHIIVVGEQYLRHILMCYMEYYNAIRTHLSLGKDAPSRKVIQRSGCIKAQPVLGGLHHHATLCRADQKRASTGANVIERSVVLNGENQAFDPEHRGRRQPEQQFGSQCHAIRQKIHEVRIEIGQDEKKIHGPHCGKRHDHVCVPKTSSVLIS